MNKAENQINDTEHKEAKTTNQNNKKKKESKKNPRKLWATSNIPTFTS